MFFFIISWANFAICFRKRHILAQDSPTELSPRPQVLGSRLPTSFSTQRRTPGSASTARRRLARYSLPSFAMFLPWSQISRPSSTGQCTGYNHLGLFLRSLLLDVGPGCVCLLIGVNFLPRVSQYFWLRHCGGGRVESREERRSRPRERGASCVVVWVRRSGCEGGACGPSGDAPG